MHPHSCQRFDRNHGIMGHHLHVQEAGHRLQIVLDTVVGLPHGLFEPSIAGLEACRRLAGNGLRALPCGDVLADPNAGPV